MSSPVSAPLCCDATTLAALAVAATNVAEDSVFAIAEACRRDVFDERLTQRPPEDAWLLAAVVFRGPFEGEFRLALPRTLASELCASFSGALPGEVEPAQVTDFAGELGNMICGLWLTRTQNHNHFTLDAPRVTCVLAPPVVPDSSSCLLLVNDAPVSLSLALASEVR